MVKPVKPIKVIIGLNFVTSFITALLACLEAFVLILCSIGSVTKGDGEWYFALRFLGVMAIIWLVCFFVALVVCRTKLVVTDNQLIVSKGKNILYVTSIDEITWIEYDVFAPVTRSQMGEMLLASKQPKPEKIRLYMGWISYKRIERRINERLNHKED